MLPELQAERQLLAIEAASVPHMTDSCRSEVVRSHQARLKSKSTRPKSLREALSAAVRRRP